MSDEISGCHELGSIESSGGFITKRKQWLAGLKPNDPVHLLFQTRTIPAVVDSIEPDAIVLRYFDGGIVTTACVDTRLGMSSQSRLYPCIAPA